MDTDRLRVADPCRRLFDHGVPFRRVVPVSGDSLRACVLGFGGMKSLTRAYSLRYYSARSWIARTAPLSLTA